MLGHAPSPYPQGMRLFLATPQKVRRLLVGQGWLPTRHRRLRLRKRNTPEEAATVAAATEGDAAHFAMMKARNHENGQPAAAAAAAEEASTAKRAPPRFDDENADRERGDVDVDAGSSARSASDFEEGDPADSGDDKDSNAYDVSDLSSFTNEFIWELYTPPPVVRLLMGVRVLRWAMVRGNGGDEDDNLTSLV